MAEEEKPIEEPKEEIKEEPIIQIPAPISLEQFVPIQHLHKGTDTPRVSYNDLLNQPLTQAEATDLTDEGSTTLHSHSIGVIFGGDGSDGALAITSGATNIDLGEAQIVLKQYTSISITGSGSLTFTNPHASGTIIILKSQGNVVLTSTATALIELGLLGGTAGAGGAAGQNGTDGTRGTAILTNVLNYGQKGLAISSGNVAGGLIYEIPNLYTDSAYKLASRTIFVACGSGGGGGGGTGVAGGNGGRGAGALVIECAGDLNFTGTIGAKGVAGSNGQQGLPSQYGSAAGGGGTGGMVVIPYKTATATSGTINTAGGNGGTGGNETNIPAGDWASGGSGAGSVAGAGGFGGGGSVAGQNGQGNSAGGGGGGSRGYQGGAVTGGTGGSSNSGLVTTNYYF